MRFRSLVIRNLKAINVFEVHDLSDFIMLAGQNGSGKSCVLDAIRLLKSFYGGYQMDEYLQWFGEFSINVHDQSGLARMLRDPNTELYIGAEIEFAVEEIQHLTGSLEELAFPLAWQRVTGQRLDFFSLSRMAVATQINQYQERLEREIESIRLEVAQALAIGPQLLELRIRPDRSFSVTDNRPAEVVFQAYQPEKLGVVEYHSASRAYTRQAVGGINLDARQFADQRRQATLYNWQNKYQNIKTELATAYVRRLIGEAAGRTPDEGDLHGTLVELFEAFFPDKTYLGVQANTDGNLEFPVRLANGATHDIDDLSSGEKEIVYGYLRLRNATPRNSVVLLDEPELHLNPGLLRGFVDFYNQHLGRARNNQLWLVTHSDVLLRQTVGNESFRVYHMLTAGEAGEGGNQAVEVLLDSDVERVVADLVGDLAAYRPHAKVVIVEGEIPSGFDVTVIQRLFPDESRRLNLVGCSSRQHVRDVYQVLEEAVGSTGMGNRFFAVVDADGIPPAGEKGSRTQVMQWDVYHIENYFLEPACIRTVVNMLRGREVFRSDEEVWAALHECASGLVEKLAVKEAQRELNDLLVGAIEVGAAPRGRDAGVQLAATVEASLTRVSQVALGLDGRKVTELIKEKESEFESALRDDSWSKRFPGRDILKCFAGEHVAGTQFGAFRNVILDRMATDRVKPCGMKEVLDRILLA